MSFEWDNDKNIINLIKHNLSFFEAQDVFYDPNRIILKDTQHSLHEKRFFCIGKTSSGNIATVRFTLRNDNIRIIGAGYWRKGKNIYEQNN